MTIKTEIHSMCLDGYKYTVALIVEVRWNLTDI